MASRTYPNKKTVLQPTRDLFKIRRVGWRKNATGECWHIYFRQKIWNTRDFPTKKAAADYLVALGHMDQLPGSVRLLYHNPCPAVPNQPPNETTEISQGAGVTPV